MSGLHALTRGRIMLDGRPVTGPRPNEIGLIFQEANLLPWRNLEQNIRFPFEIRRTRADTLRIDSLLRETGLVGFEHAYPRELSGGMQQRASIVRALAQDPAVLLMDEPFGALDPITRLTLQREFVAWQRRLGTAVVFVTHDVAEALRLGDRVAVMDHGRVAQSGTPEEIRSRPEPEFVRPFLEAAGLA